MEEFGSISGLIEASEERLSSALHDEQFFVTSLLAARKIVSAGIREAALKTPLNPRSKDLHRYLFQNLAHRREEFLIGFFADDYGGFIAEAILAMGDGQGAEVSARGVLQRTLSHGAGQFLLVHNHPSKSCAPSRKDLQATRKIRKMASALGISLLDHLIVGGQRIYSICQGRML
ncbi:MAG: hypothetical protein A3J40_12620 [Erythrobacter sp. RIFCSPHIGHO2_12_FULL_63_10]|nr:MAG: hypothetical protein A3J40_12620 [Erythrobacter sp. RIFCSPHIGHO2_12_FULL_63_10]